VESIIVAPNHIIIYTDNIPLHVIARFKSNLSLSSGVHWKKNPVHIYSSGGLRQLVKKNEEGDELKRS